jgi:phosphohistidine phosphatase
MGERLAESAFAPDYVLCSTARRARQTADLVLEALEFDGPFDVRDGIYHATPRELLAGIAQAGAGERLLVIGHNPGLSELVELLTNDNRHMPTAAIAVIELPIAEWSEIVNAKGRLIDFMKPKDDD